MKKLINICLILALALSLCVPVFAAEGQVIVEVMGDVTPGSTILVSVNVVSGSSVAGCQVEPLFDSTMFQLLSGNWTQRPDLETTAPASGAKVAEWATPRVLQGEVFTFTLKVLSGTAGTQTSVSCRIDAWDETDLPVALGPVTEAKVIMGCSHTTYQQKEDPAYIKTPGDCKTPAVYFVSCAACGQKGTDTFTAKAPGEHSFTAQVEKEDYLAQAGDCVTPAQYYYSCTGCGLKGTEIFTSTAPGTHRFEAMTETEDYLSDPGDCKTPATYFYSCTGCGEKGTEVFTSTTPGGHRFEAKVETEEYLSDPGDCQTRRSYFYSCTACGEKGTEVFSSEKKFGVHQYANECDSDCNVCGKYQEPTHQPDTEWSADATGHWHICLQCRQKVDHEPHVAGPEATSEEHQTCTVCQFVLAVSNEHRCEFSAEWDYDERSHWHACECGKKSDLGAHRWTNVETDRTDVVISRCLVCGMTHEEEVPEEPTAGTQPTGPSDTSTAPTDTRPTEPQDPPSSGGPSVAVIVLSILLGLSLAGNGVLGYLLYMTKKGPQRPDTTEGR